MLRGSISMTFDVRRALASHAANHVCGPVVADTRSPNEIILPTSHPSSGNLSPVLSHEFLAVSVMRLRTPSFRSDDISPKSGCDFGNLISIGLLSSCRFSGEYVWRTSRS